MQGTRGEQQAARRARVVTAARRLAEQGGYEAVQMRAVAQLADVALGTIYRYFSSKDQLLLAVLSKLAEGIEAEIGEDPPRGATAAERVADVMRRSCALLEAKPRLTHAVVTALATSDPAALEVRDQVNDQLQAIIGKALDGEAGVDVEGVVHVLAMVWGSAMQAWITGRSAPGTMAAELELASRLLLARR